MKHYRTNKGLRVLYSILIAILAAALLGGAIFGVIKLVEFSNRETKKLNPSWTNGALDASGVYRKTNGSIYTKDAFGCQGLNVELPFDTSVTYQIYFYDNEGIFLDCRGHLVQRFCAVQCCVRKVTSKKAIFLSCFRQRKKTAQNGSCQADCGIKAQRLCRKSCLTTYKRLHQ